MKISSEIRDKLEELKCNTIGNILENENKLKEIMKNIKNFDWLLEMCKGNDSSPVIQTKPPKSLSVSMTLTPISHNNCPQIQRIFDYLTTNLYTRVSFDTHGMFFCYFLSFFFSYFMPNRIF